MLPESEIVNLYRILGNNIKEKRIEVGYNQTQFAHLLKISRASLVNIECGRQRPPIHLLFACASLLKAKVSDILPSSTVEEVKEIDLREKLLLKIKELSDGKTIVEEPLIKFYTQQHKKEIK